MRANLQLLQFLEKNLIFGKEGRPVTIKVDQERPYNNRQDFSELLVSGPY